MATTFNYLSSESETFAMAACIKVKRWDRKMFLDKFLAPHLHKDIALQLFLKQLHSLFLSLTLRSAVHFLPDFLISINKPLIIAHFVLSFAFSSCCRSCCCRRVSIAAISCHSFVSDCALRFSQDVRSAAKSAFDIFLL